MDMQIAANGNLTLVMDDRDERKELIAAVREGYERALYRLHEYLEPNSCNGSYAFFDAGNGNPFVGLTNAPCIAEALDYHDDGSITINGSFWYYPDYMVKCFLTELAKHGKVTFELAKEG